MSTSQHQHNVIFASLGMVVLDEIRFQSGKTLDNVIGGSGAYSTLGARMFQEPSSAASIGWVIKTGSDLPKESRDFVNDWAITLIFQEDNDQKATRGLLVYKDASHTDKSFEYTTPPLLLQPTDLARAGLIRSSSFHMLSGPGEVAETVQDLMDLRRSVRLNDRPLIVWEPRPSDCKAMNLQAFQAAAREVDVFSPNHAELAALFMESSSHHEELSRDHIDTCASRFYENGLGGPDGHEFLVVRSGEQGCCIVSKSGGSLWSPPYYQATLEGSDPHVVDPTGAGNAFLGAFTVGFLQRQSIYDAACYGAVGASFALEQHGMPSRGLDEHGREVWNGDVVSERLRRYQNNWKP